MRKGGSDAPEISVWRLGGRGEGPLLRVALVADLHDRQGGAALRALDRLRPDAIAAAGDMIECGPLGEAEREADIAENSDEGRAAERFFIALDGLLFRKRKHREPESENGLRFLRAASQIAPVWYALGNHERAVSDACRQAIVQTGALLLDDEARLLRLRGARLLVGGLTSRGSGAGAGRRAVESDGGTRLLAQFRRAREEGVPGLLLCHHPEYAAALPQADFLAILCGHAHGGQIRLWGRGLFAPGQGLFPRMTYGVYDGRVAVTRGLANTARMPRLGNPTEIALLEISL